MTSDAKLLEGIEEYKYGFRTEEVHVFQSPRKGLDRGIVEQISAMKGEPQWMLDFRLKALAHFEQRPTPEWGGDLSKLNLDEIYFYTKPTDKEGLTWDDVPEAIKETFDKLGIPEAEQKFLAGVGAQYECLSEDSRVYSHRGLVPIRDIEPGDIVFSLEEETKKLIAAPVKAKVKKGVRKVFEVVAGCRSIKATENHPFYVLDYHRAEDRKRGRYTPKWKYLRDIKEGDLVCVSKDLPDVGRSHRLVQPKVATVVVGRNQAVEFPLDISNRYNPISLPEETSVDLMWWLGLYIGDGFIHYEKGREKARVEIAIPATDIELREQVIKVTETLFSVETKTKDPYRLTIYSTVLARFLEENGFKGKANQKSIPGWVGSLPRAEMLAFLGGYIDADGYVRNSKQNKDVVLTSVNAELLTQVSELASMCGLPTSNLHRFDNPHPSETGRYLTGYRMQFYGDFERLGCRSPQRVSRFGKRNFYHRNSSAAGTQFRTHTSDAMGFVRVTSIKPAGLSTVYDIEVDGPHNFVAEGFIVHNSEMVYHSIKEHLAEKGVIFKSIEQGLKDHEDLFREYFGTVIPIEDNKFAALNSAVWSGGSFVYVPPGVTVDMPLQAYFRINTADMGQFERTLIIIDEGAQAHYVEGCTAPMYTTDSFHSGVIEIVVKKNARMRYTTIQNWSTNMYNLVTQRALVYENGTMEWVDANLGCLKEGSTVTTPDGLKAIENLSVGENVLSFDPDSGSLCFRPVVAKRFSGYQKVREVSAGERRLFATSNHPFLSFTYNPDRPKKLGRYQLDYVRADQLEKAIVPQTSIEFGRPYPLALPEVETTFATKNQYQNKLVATRVRQRRLKVTQQTDEKLMWLFGLYLGDGHIRRAAGKSTATRYASVGFSIPSESRARAKLQNVMAELLDTAPTHRGDDVQLTWNSVELADLFEMHGFTGKAQTKRIPAWVFSIPEGQRLALLAGYLDSDGTIAPKKRRFSIKSVNKDLLEDAARVATSLGIDSRLYTEFEGVREVRIREVASKANGAHRLELPLDERLLPFLSDEMRVRVEQVRPATLRHFRRVGRSSINLPESVEILPVSVGEPSDEEVPTWDIEVAGTGNFVSEGFIVHNSKLTMKYPSCYLLGERAHGEILSLAFAAHGQHQDTGGKIIHVAPNTSSVITSKSISKNGGRASYRGLLKVHPEAEGSSSNVVCDALLLDDRSRSDTYPYIEIDALDVTIGHEASVSKVGEEQLFYLMSRGLSEDEATTMVVAGFIEPLVKELPMEYAVEMNRLIQLQMEGSIG